MRSIGPWRSSWTTASPSTTLDEACYKAEAVLMPRPLPTGSWTMPIEKPSKSHKEQVRRRKTTPIPDWQPREPKPTSQSLPQPWETACSRRPIRCGRRDRKRSSGPLPISSKRGSPASRNGCATRSKRARKGRAAPARPKSPTKFSPWSLEGEAGQPEREAGSPWTPKLHQNLVVGHHRYRLRAARVGAARLRAGSRSSSPRPRPCRTLDRASTDWQQMTASRAMSPRVGEGSLQLRLKRTSWIRSPISCSVLRPQSHHVPLPEARPRATLRPSRSVLKHLRCATRPGLSARSPQSTPPPCRPLQGIGWKGLPI